MMLSVYLETSFFSECCTIRTSEIARGRRATSLSWWADDASKFDLYISGEVVRELSSPDFPPAVRDPALAMLRGLTLLPTTPEVVSFAERLVDERVMPGPVNAGDALHVAVSVVHQMGYLLTWNQRHLAKGEQALAPDNHRRPRRAAVAGIGDARSDANGVNR